jgi:formylglycine-generating enzyme required for sulfatase activity
MAKENARVGEAALAAGTVRQNLKDGLKYVWIPPGTFMMGCSPGDNECENEEKPAHQVTITKGFWMGQTPVTVGAYKRFAAATGRQMSGAPDYNPDWADENMPIDWIEWTDAGAYCHWAGGHLPTEAEWEYAARGGSTGERYGNLDDIAWYDANSGGKAHDVAQKRPNGFGLYDMLGNMWEWVNDYYDPHYYENSPAQDPTGPAKGDLLAMHGGDWRSRAGLVRVSYRLSCSVTFRQWLGCGFRCAGEALPVVPVSSPEALAQRQAEAERERQAEEKAREIKETLGDEIAVQVSYLGLVHASDSNVPNDAKAYLDGVVGYKIRNPRMFVNRNNGSLTIVFDCQLNGGTTTPTQMLVRLFDANGAYLTHFITQEWFVAPNARFNPSPYYHTYSLRQGQNSVQYSVNIRDAAFAKQAEFGWYLPPR